MFGENSKNTKTWPSIPLTLSGSRQNIDNNTSRRQYDQVPSSSTPFQDDNHCFRTITPRSIKREHKSTRKKGVKRIRKNRSTKVNTTLQERAGSTDTNVKQQTDDLSVDDAFTTLLPEAEELKKQQSDASQSITYGMTLPGTSLINPSPTLDKQHDTPQLVNDRPNFTGISSTDKAMKQEDDNEIWEIHIDPKEEEEEEEAWEISEYHSTEDDGLDTQTSKHTEWNKEPESSPMPNTFQLEPSHEVSPDKDDVSDCSSIIDLCCSRMDHDRQNDTQQEIETQQEMDTQQEVYTNQETETNQEMETQQEMIIDEDRFYDALDLNDHILHSLTDNDSDTSEDYLSPSEG